MYIEAVLNTSKSIKYNGIPMKKIISVIALTLFMSFSSYGAEKVSCEDLTEVADALDELGAAFKETATIREGDEIDKILGEVVDVITEIAELENESSLLDSADSLVSAYNDMDSERFSLSIDSVTANLDRLYRRDCD